MLAQSGAEALAEMRFRRALELDPRSQAAAFELARILLDRGEGPRARQILEELLTHCPDDPDCLYNLACCLGRLGAPLECLRMLEKAMAHGFEDLEKIGDDPDLKGIRQSKEFAQLTGQAIT
jgi:predicted Zn-dependent protease